jgi:rubrerythrin
VGGDLTILSSLLETARTAIAGYEAGLDVLAGRGREIGRSFLDHERQHALGLEQAIRSLGGEPPRARRPADYASGFRRPTRPTEALELALRLERMSVMAYLRAIPRLSDPRLRQTAAVINTTAAEHLAVLRGELGRVEAPEALVGGAITARAVRTGRRAARPETEARVLESAVAREDTAVVVYDTTAKSGLLEGRAARTARLFRDQAEEHADKLATELRALGGEAPASPQPNDVRGLSELRRAADVASFAIGLESEAVRAYRHAVGRLEDPRLLVTCAQIMANRGQHLAVLRPLLGKPPVPDAFELGRP